MRVQYVGHALKRLEDPKLIAGADPFVADVRLGVEHSLTPAKVWATIRAASR